MGIVCDDGVLLVAETPGKSKLSAGAKKMQSVGDRLAVASSGLVGDAALVMDELRAASPKTTDEVIRAMRSTLHRFTLSRTQRPLGVAFLAGSILDRKPRLVYLDPSGAAVESLAMAMGRGAKAAQGVLESRYKKLRLAEAERLIPELFGRDTPTEVARVSG